MKRIALLLIASLLFQNCKGQKTEEVAKQEEMKEAPFVWEGANLYFLLTDRFNNGDKSNDIVLDRTKETAVNRGFEGGDLKGITQKIKEGYFTDLGINALWMTPVVEQIHGGTDEGTGVTYGFHGYWTKDWTAIDPNYGTKEDLKNLVEAAHSKGIRVVLDAVINHTGPVTEKDPVWPSEWVRTEPQCQYSNYENTITCTLVKNLPDIKTESDEEVQLPPQLVEKWKAEGRYEQEVAELDAFFKRTGYPRAPRFYIMKWLTDYITEFGIDGYRVDTVKHTEESVWQEFRKECDFAFTEWKKEHPEKVLDGNNFYLVGEVYNYGIHAGKAFNFGDKVVNYYDKAFDGLINFDFKWNAKQWKTYEQLFSFYDAKLHGDLNGYSVMNYISSHDDGQPFDVNRERTIEGGTKLLLTPGVSQVYYGDEIARPLRTEGAEGDAHLRLFMTWDATKDETKAELFNHFKKLGKFRKNHAAVGAGKHKMISESPYIFKRTYNNNDYTDEVIIGLDLTKRAKSIAVGETFKDGTKVRDAYSNQEVTVKEGKVIIDSPFDIVLLESIQ